MSTETNPAAGLSYHEDTQHSPASDPDAGVVEQCRQGDLGAFEQLVAKHQKRMLNIAYRLTGDYDDACEAVQDAFVAAYKSMHAFRGDAKFSTWMTTITLNHARNRLKQTAARRSRFALSLDAPITTDQGEVMPDPPSQAPSVLDRLEARDIGLKVRGCIGELEPEYREVIILRDLQDLSYEEIGMVLKARPGTVKSRLFRAREAVRECLKKALDVL